ncbi:murein hydrolase activator EnvC family protein [Caminibacter sp.]
MRFLIIFFSVFLFAASVKTVKKELIHTKANISKMNSYLDNLAKKIAKKQKEINHLNNQISKLNTQIQNLQKLLKNSNSKLGKLQDLKNGYSQQLKKIQDEINYFLSTNYYISNKSIDNINDLINQEVTKEILKQYSQKIAALANEEADLKQNIFQTSQEINAILDKQKTLQNKKNQLLTLKKKREKELRELAKQKEIYKRKLYAMIKKQQELQAKLKKLSIIKTTKHYPNVTLPTKIYRGIKTIAPVRGIVVKRFGSYIDPVYKFRVYNDSITIKPYQKNAVIRAVMSGRVVYIDPKKGIIIIKHKNYLFSIYANLSRISPILKKGSFVKRGQIIARVQNTLEFEITYKDRPINPLKVISLR